MTEDQRGRADTSTTRRAVEEPRRVTTANWQDSDLITWSFQNVDRILPVVPVPHSVPGVELTAAPVDLRDTPVSTAGGHLTTAGDVLDETDTDGWMVLHRNVVVTEAYAGEMQPESRHLLQSVSKSLVSSVVGALVGLNIVDPEASVSSYVPELASSGYAGATVRHLLDMRSGVRFSENYSDPGSDSRVLEAVVGWAPMTSLDGPRTMRDFLLRLRQSRPHGGPFEYRSCETDGLGWICEAAAGKPFSELASDLLWSRIGAQYDAYICVDAAGTGVFDGGLCATLGDLARFGAMVLGGGRSLSGHRVLPTWWVDDLFVGGQDSTTAFAASAAGTQMPGGKYRSQFWSPTASRDVLVCLGIHGQMIYLDRAARVVGVKLSSWPEPESPRKLALTLRMFDQLSVRLRAT